MGHPGDDATDPQIDKAFAQGIIFTTANTALPKAQEKYGPEGMGYVGAPNHAAGYALGAEAAKRAGLKAGDEAFVWGLKGQGGDRGSRTVGVIEAIEKAGGKVIYQEIDKATDADPNAGTATFVGVMKANPGIKLVVTDHGALTANVGVYARAASLKPGQVFFAGFDMSPNTAKAIKDGYQDLVIDQQPYLQGYLPILNICLTKKFGFSGLDINTAGAFVDPEERRRRRAAGGEGNPVKSSARRGAARSGALGFSRERAEDGMAEPATSSAGEPPVIELQKRLQDVRRSPVAGRRQFPGQSAGDRRPARRQRRGQVDARQGRDGLSYARSRRRNLLPRQARGRLVGRARRAASASRRSIRSGRCARSSRSGATCSWGASCARASACSTSTACGPNARG